MIEVFVLDDQFLVRQGIERILEDEDDIILSGQAATWRELAELLAARKPDVIVLDITMPDRSGFDVLRDLRSMYPEIPVLVLSVHSEEAYVARALSGGAAGYLDKVDASSKLANAIRSAAGGKEGGGP